MAVPTVGLAFASSIVFDGGFFLEILSIGWSGFSRDVIETTNMNSGSSKDFKPDEIYDPGELEVEFHFFPGTQPALEVGDVATSCVVDFGGGGDGSKWSATAFMTNFSITANMGEKLTATATLKFTGDITLS